MLPLVFSGKIKSTCNRFLVLWVAVVVEFIDERALLVSMYSSDLFVEEKG